MANAPEADFYGIEQLLDDAGRDAVRRTREFMTKEVEPVINHYWTREEFPHELVPGFARLGIAGVAYEGYGCPGGGPLLDGVLAMELARTDPSMSTFMGVHSGLAMGSIYLCGSEEQKQRWLPEMARMEKIGAFGLTEPDVGSGGGGRPHHDRAPRRRRVGPRRPEEVDRQRHVRRLHHHLGAGRARTARSRASWWRRAHRACRPEDARQDRAAGRAERPHHAGRGPGARGEPAAAGDSFRETAEVLRLTRAGVAWQAVGCAMGAYEHALAYAKERSSSAGRSRDSSWCRTCWCGCSATSRPRPACAPGWPSCRPRGGRDEHSALAKAFCTVRMRETVGYARELLGGNGILLENQVGRFVADAEAIYSYEGTREINTLVVGRAITGLSAFVCAIRLNSALGSGPAPMLVHHGDPGPPQRRIPSPASRIAPHASHRVHAAVARPSDLTIPRRRSGRPPGWLSRAARPHRRR